MADVTVAAGGIGTPEIVLSPGQVYTVEFAEDVPAVEVVVSACTSPVWWTCDGSTPAPGTGYYVPAPGIDEREPPMGGPSVVKLVSSSAATLRVQRT